MAAIYSPLFTSGLQPHTPRGKYNMRLDVSTSSISSGSGDPSEYSPIDTKLPERASSPPLPPLGPAFSVNINVPPPTTTKGGSQPKLRKRRSSLTPAAAPMPGVKSPNRSASSAARSRAGSVVAMTGAPTSTGFVGRLRSATLSGIGHIRSKRGLKFFAPPSKPAPTAPLPPIPVDLSSAPASSSDSKPPTQSMDVSMLSASEH